MKRTNYIADSFHDIISRPRVLQSFCHYERNFRSFAGFLSRQTCVKVESRNLATLQVAQLFVI